MLDLISKYRPTGIMHSDERWNELKKLKFNGQIAFKYEESFNPNGSVENIAGVLSENGRILGMMPHPERSVFDHHNSLDGKLFLQNLMEQLLS